MSLVIPASVVEKCRSVLWVNLDLIRRNHHVNKDLSPTHAELTG